MEEQHVRIVAVIVKDSKVPTEKSIVGIVTSKFLG